MQSVIQTSIFLSQAKKAGVTEAEMVLIVDAIAADPESGDLMEGTGGARKLRHAREGQGKRGGYRTIHYFGGGDIPVFLLAIYAKNDKANLSKADQNTLAKVLSLLAAEYRKTTKKDH